MSFTTIRTVAADCDQTGQGDFPGAGLSVATLEISDVLVGIAPQAVVLCDDECLATIGVYNLDWGNAPKESFDGTSQWGHGVWVRGRKYNDRKFTTQFVVQVQEGLSGAVTEACRNQAYRWLTRQLRPSGNFTLAPGPGAGLVVARNYLSELKYTSPDCDGVVQDCRRILAEPVDIHGPRWTDGLDGGFVSCGENPLCSGPMFIYDVQWRAPFPLFLDCEASEHVFVSDGTPGDGGESFVVTNDGDFPTGVYFEVGGDFDTANPGAGIYNNTNNQIINIDGQPTGSYYVDAQHTDPTEPTDTSARPHLSPQSFMVLETGDNNLDIFYTDATGVVTMTLRWFQRYATP